MKISNMMKEEGISHLREDVKCTICECKYIIESVLENYQFPGEDGSDFFEYLILPSKPSEKLSFDGKCPSEGCDGSLVLF